MDSDKHAALHDTDNCCGKCSLQSFVHTDSECQSHDRLPAAAQKNRQTEDAKLLQTVDDLQVLLICFGKADAGIQDDLIIRNTGLLRQMYRLCQVRRNILQEGFILRIRSVVHQTAGQTALCDDPSHIRVILQPPDIIDQVCPGCDSRQCDLRFVGIQ